MRDSRDITRLSSMPKGVAVFLDSGELRWAVLLLPGLEISTIPTLEEA